MAYREAADGPVLDRSEHTRRERGAPNVGRFPDDHRHERANGARVAWTVHRSPFPELDCIRDRLSLGMIAAVERRAIQLGVGAERVLVASGGIDEESYLIALAEWLGWTYEDFSNRSRESCALDDDQLIDAARTGLLPLVIDGEPSFVVAPRSVRDLLGYARNHPRLSFRLASSARLNGFIADHMAEPLGSRAADALLRVRPDLSAGHRDPRILMVFATIAALFVGGLFTDPGTTLVVANAILASVFLTWLMFRLLGCMLASKPQASHHIPDRELPVYTVIVALYREAESVHDLIASLRALDYPPEKLDIKLVIEAYDRETWPALQRIKPGAPFEIIVAPQAGPRTKPKALNAALPFAQGTFTVVFDAEDRPDRDQLRRAVDMFMTEGHDVACVQARLTIDNTDDGLLARLFTAEYAAQFDLFLPGLARMRLPIPLGGSSNHFRTHVLRSIGAWDAYNVTEDADLGMRLARFGYRSAVIDSTTYEEAPAYFVPWLRQRTRWFKGWMQTWAVHMRHPMELLRDLGLGGFLTFQLAVGGSVLAALVHPIFGGLLIWTLIANEWPFQFSVEGGFFFATMIAGYLTTALVGLRGLAKRGLLASAWALIFIPIHWLLLSIAAWRATYQVIFDPHRWEKTEHGLAKNSRRADMSGDTSTLPSTIEQPSNSVRRRQAT
jgi:cellulose synthase/poly-beta-1,6-N-acetylglucosamine synthase-like glycosyltransferase